MDLEIPSVSAIQRKSRKIISYSEKRLRNLSPLQRKTANRAIRLISRNLDSVGKFLGIRKYYAADEFFFRFEALPLLGKEYWFMYFVDPASRKQLVATFGRSTPGMEVNRVQIRGSAGARTSAECAAVIWLFDGKSKKVLVDNKGTVEIFGGGEGKVIDFHAGKASLSFSGKYPDYALDAGSGRGRISLRLRKSAKGKPYEIQNMLAGNIGMGLVNLYFSFSGKLLGKPFAGKCYVQKVILNFPFVPWNWGRAYFVDGGVFEFFAPYYPLLPAKFQIASFARYFDPKLNRLLHFKSLQVERLENGNRWHVYGEGFSLFARPYASHAFTFRRLGEFRYLEYFVEALDFEVRGKERGKGAGIIEDAYGFLA